MTWPAGLPLVSVHCHFDLPPLGGTPGGTVTFISTGPLLGATDNSIVPPFALSLALDLTGDGTITLPATNAPLWTPVNWSYLVQVTIGNGVNWLAGTLQLNYLTLTVELSDLLQVSGTALPGVSYIPLSTLGQPNGPAQLDGSGNLTVPVLNATTGVNAGALIVTGAATAASLAATGAVSAGSLTVTGAAGVGSLTVTGAASAASLTVSGAASAASLLVGGVDFRLATAPPNPVDQGLTGWTYDPAPVPLAGTILPTAGLGQVVRFRALTTVISSINFFVTVGGSALVPGQCRAALFNDAGALLGGGAVTGSLDGTGPGGWGDAGYKTCPLSVAQGVVRYDWYRIMFWANGGVLPTFGRGTTDVSMANGTMAAPTLRFSTADAGLTTTAPGNLGAQTPSAPAWWVGATP